MADAQSAGGDAAFVRSHRSDSLAEVKRVRQQGISPVFEQIERCRSTGQWAVPYAEKYKK